MSGLWVTPEELGQYYSTEYAFEAASTASFLLWALSGRKYSGIHTVTERYDAITRAIDIRHSGVPAAYKSDIASRNRIPGLFENGLRLKNTPVIDVLYYGAPGAEPVTTGFWVEDRAILRFGSPVDGDIEVTYTYGQLPPVAGRMAARQLAIEFARAWGGDPECQLPDRITSVNRQGVSWTILDNQDFIADLRTGVYAVDLFLKTVNPDNARKRAKVFSPDLRRGRKKTGNGTAGGYGEGGYGY
jgi:hypothetical protein